MESSSHLGGVSEASRTEFIPIPKGAIFGNRPGSETTSPLSGCRGQTIGKPKPICPSFSISSRMVDQVGFFRRLEAFPMIYRPCLARERATLIRFSDWVGRQQVDKRYPSMIITFRNPIDALSVSKSPEFLTSETITIFAS